MMAAWPPTVPHMQGPATGWIGGSRASFVVRNDLDFYILVTYETALEAMGRRIEELSAGTEVKAFIEVASPAERQAFVTAADLDPTWMDRSAGHGLVETVKPIATSHAHGYARPSFQRRCAIISSVSGTIRTSSRPMAIGAAASPTVYDGHEQ